MASLNDHEVRKFEGTQPAMSSIDSEIFEEIIKETTPQYVQFLATEFISDSAEKAREISKKAGVESKVVGEKPFFMTDEDFGINGSIGSSFAMVKPGKPNKPLRIIIAHSDVPSLRIPVSPLFTAESTKQEMMTPSISLCTEPFGGVRPDDWYGMDVKVIGKMYIQGIEKKIELPGRIKQKSLHVDHPAIMKDFEGLKIDTGYMCAKDLYRVLGIHSADDFARARLYCLPSLKNWQTIGNELGGFGHDDRSCVWASLKAGIESLVGNDNTTMIFALDNEEIGSVGNSASYRGFFENVVRETLKVVYGKKAKDIELPMALNRELLGGMPAIFADVGVGLSTAELSDQYGLVDQDRASRLGWGVMINTSITTSPKHVDKFVTLLRKNLPGNKRYLRYQIGGDYTPVDGRYGWAGSVQMHDSFGDVMPCLNVGIPVSGLHHPRTEAINVFDLHWMKEAYKVYLKN
jgi:aspartyl aminopeptidase